MLALFDSYPRVVENRGIDPDWFYSKMPFAGEVNPAKVHKRRLKLPEEPVDKELLQSKIAALNNHYDFLVVGGGLFGSTFACRATQLKKSCLVIERQPQVGGLLASVNIGGVTVQKCGVHLFSTTKQNVMKFVQKYAEWKLYQSAGVPVGGYSTLIQNILEGIPVITGISYQNLIRERPDLTGKVIYTGPLDEYFHYKFGYLLSTGVKLTFEERDQEWYQYKAIRYEKDDTNWTRVVEYKHFLNEKSSKTIVCRETVAEFCERGMMPYRVLDSKKNGPLVRMYREEAEKVPDIEFCGTHGTCKHMDMAETIAAALALADRLAKEPKKKQGGIVNNWM